MGETNKKDSDDIQRKRFMLTINNPEKYEMSHEKIIEAIHSAFAKQGIIYFCLCDEIGESGTYHTHIFIMITKKKALVCCSKRVSTRTHRNRGTRYSAGSRCLHQKRGQKKR